MMNAPRRVAWPLAGGAFAIWIATTTFAPVPVLAGDTDRNDLRFGAIRSGKQLFEKETFGGNGRTCLTCHSRDTGTVSPADAQERFAIDAHDPLFLADGSDDGRGNGVSRILADATILVTVPLAKNVTLASDPSARTVTLRRGIPTTLNTPALDPVLMVDGREPSLVSQAGHAIADHAQATRTPKNEELKRIADFEQTYSFFSSHALRKFARTGREPQLPYGWTASERRGRKFFENVPPSPANVKAGLCASCHSGPMLNEVNAFAPPVLTKGGRFASVLVSELNEANNPVLDFVFKNTDGSATKISSPDPGRALITGDASDPVQSVNAFKIPTLWGVARTAPYFHDNSAKTLEDLARHYAKFFKIITAPPADGHPSSGLPVIDLSEQDQADIVAYLKLLR